MTKLVSLRDPFQVKLYSNHEQRIRSLERLVGAGGGGGLSSNQLACTASGFIQESYPFVEQSSAGQLFSTGGVYMGSIFPYGFAKNQVLTGMIGALYTPVGTPNATIFQYALLDTTFKVVAVTADKHVQFNASVSTTSTWFNWPFQATYTVPSDGTALYGIVYCNSGSNGFVMASTPTTMTVAHWTPTAVPPRIYNASAGSSAMTVGQTLVPTNVQFMPWLAVY